MKKCERTCVNSRVTFTETTCTFLESQKEKRGREGHRLYLKEISPQYSLEGLMLKLKLQYFDNLM